MLYPPFHLCNIDEGKKLLNLSRTELEFRYAEWTRKKFGACFAACLPISAHSRVLSSI